MAMTRIGWCIAPEDVTGAIRKVHDFLTVGAAAPLQEAGALALAQPASYYEELAGGYRWRRDLNALLESRIDIIQQNGLDEEGIGLIWPIPWDGNKSLTFSALDPFYLEICRRIRLIQEGSRIIARATG